MGYCNQASRSCFPLRQRGTSVPPFADVAFQKILKIQASNCFFGIPVVIQFTEKDVYATSGTGEDSPAVRGKCRAATKGRLSKNYYLMRQKHDICYDGNYKLTICCVEVRCKMSFRTASGGGRVRQTALPVIPQLRVLFHPNSTFIHKEPVFLLDGTAVLCYNANSFRFFRGSSLKRRRPFRPQDRTTPLSPLFLGACTVFAATPIRKCREPVTRQRFCPSQKI